MSEPEQKCAELIQKLETEGMQHVKALQQKLVVFCSLKQS